MARKMKKFSAGGAQGRYDRRMADIEKDFKKNSAGKSGRALEVLEAKRAQRTADAKDDLAKRTGADRTATRKAEYDAEKNLSRTRKFGADKPTAAADPAKAELAAQVAAAPEAAKAKPKTTREEFNAAFRAARNDPAAMKRGTFTFRGTSYSTKMAGEGRKASTGTGAGTAGSSTNNSAAASAAAAAKNPPAAAAKNPPVAAAKNPPAAAAKVTGPSTKRGLNPNSIAGMIASGKLLSTPDSFRKSQEAKYGKAKGGSVKKEKTMKYAKGGSTASQPVPPKKKPKEPITGGANTVPLTPERKEFLKELAKRNAKPGMAKGGKATKFGKAMVKKSADTKGRAMMKFAKGGSIDGCAIRGKTKGKMLASGGSCGMGKGRK
jgi:hypothetical protein